jgi:uncharacterized RDD family membrane protein YckC
VLTPWLVIVLGGFWAIGVGERTGVEAMAPERVIRGDVALATVVQRLVAWVVDACVAGLVFLPLNPGLYSQHPSPSLWWGLLIPTLVLLIGYLALFDGGPRGATPGKRVVGIRVIDATTGAAIGYRRGAIRRLGYLGGGVAFFLGWIWVLVDPRRQAWHDKVAATLVVRARPRGQH